MAAKPTIQKGSYSISNSQAASWTIARGVQSGFDTTVDEAKTILLVSFDPNVAGIPSKLRWQLTDGDTITIDRGTSGVGTNLTTTINWTLISFASGVTVQHKAATIASSTSSETVAITGAGSGGRFIITNGAGLGGSPTVGDWASRWVFNSDIQLGVSRQSTSTNALLTACQVVEWDNATVQTVTLSAETWAAATLDKAISTVDTAKTLVFGSGFLTTNGPADMNVTFSLPNTTTLRLTRAGTTSRVYNATMYVVSIADGVAVRYIDTALTAVTSNTTTLSPAVVTADTVLHTASLQNNWPTGSTTETDIRRWMGRSTLTDTTTLTLARNIGTGNVTYTTQVVEFVQVGPTITVQPANDVGIISNGQSTVYTATATGTNVQAPTWSEDATPIADGGIYDIVTTGAGTSSCTSTLTITRTVKTGTPFDIKAGFDDDNGSTDTNTVTDTWWTGPSVTTFPATDGSGESTATLTCDYVTGVGEAIEVRIPLSDGDVAVTVTTT